MTGNQTRKKASAVFFAFVMVTSMMAVGFAGFAGSAAADGTDNQTLVDTTASPGETLESTNLTVPAPAGGGTLNVTKISITNETGVYGGIGQDIDSITIKNSSTGNTIGENTSFSTDFSDESTPSGGIIVPINDGNGIDVSAGDTYRYDVSYVMNDTGIPNGNDIKLKAQSFNATAGSNSYIGNPVSTGLTTTTTGSFSVDTFDQANRDERVNVNVSFTTPSASSQGVNESSITLVANNSEGLNDQNITLIKNGELTDNVTDVNTDFDDNGNVTIDVDAELPEDVSNDASDDEYQLDLESDVTDDGSNIITAATNGLGTKTTNVSMAPAKLEVTPDVAAFANSDGDAAADDENATVNVTVVDRFGNQISEGGDVNATVSLTSNDNSVSITNTSTSTDTLGVRSAVTPSSPFQFGVENTEAEDVTLTALDTDSSDSSVNSGTGVQTFVGQIEGVDVTMNKSTLVADDTEAAEA